jgi:hypothetical protein
VLLPGSGDRLENKSDAPLAANELNIEDSVQVRKGEIVLRRIPGRKPEDGFNIFGETIKAKKSESGVLRPGKNVKMSKDDVNFVAQSMGVLCIADGFVNVYEQIKIDGDIDNTTGDVKFEGSVLLNGSL